MRRSYSDWRIRVYLFILCDINEVKVSFTIYYQKCKKKPWNKFHTNFRRLILCSGKMLRFSTSNLNITSNFKAEITSLSTQPAVLKRNFLEKSDSLKVIDKST